MVQTVLETGNRSRRRHPKEKRRHPRGRQPASTGNQRHLGARHNSRDLLAVADCAVFGAILAAWSFLA